MIRKVLALSLLIMVGGGCAHGPSGQDKLKPLIRYEFSKSELTDLCESAIASTKKQLTDWQMKYNKPNNQDPQALLAFEGITAKLGDIVSPLIFMGAVSMDKSLRDEAAKCEELNGVLFNDIVTNKNSYNILKGIKTSDKDQARLLKETLFTFEMNGMQLDDEKLTKFKALKDRLSQLEVQFSQNLNNDTSSVTFSADELKGAKTDFLARLKKDSHGKYIVTTKSPDYLQVMENVAISETRKKMTFAYNNRQAEANTKILQEATKIRAEMAQLMGYSTYADYELRGRMAGSSKQVYQFLRGLKSRLARKYKSDLAELVEFKKKNLNDKTPVVSWDIPYLANQLKIQKYEVDEEVLREYFPAKYVVDQTLGIYSQLLGVEFQHIEKASVWAPLVDLYQVRDAKTHDVIAHFYADLIPREGKYGHAAAFPLVSGCMLSDGVGGYQKPVAAIVANFSPAAPGKPVLLTHDEVETFFHEFGHIMHQVLTRAKYASLSGSNVKRDFVEAPSQMLENWVWQTEILKKMSQHYQETNKHLPDDLIAKLQKLRVFNSGIQHTRQLVFGFFDMNIHTNPKLDVTAEYARVHQELTGLSVVEGTHFPATFGHMLGGYSAGYYGYLWSKVFAEDMFSVFLKKGVLDPGTGMRYRKVILEEGNMREPMDLIKSFLGREPNNEAFFKSLGV